VKQLSAGPGPGRGSARRPAFPPPDDYDDSEEYEDDGDFDPIDEGFDPEDFPVGGEDFADEDYDEPEVPTQPDFAGMSKEEVKEGFLEWIRSNPENKQAVMDMVPELMTEVTG
jgi:hypothetical protein